MEGKDIYDRSMVSLYDYMGKPAGKELGGKVYLSAMNNKVTVLTRKVVSSKGTFQVRVYPRYFLDYFFSQNPIK